MAYVNVAEWKPEQVTEWLKGLDNNLLQYVHSFLNNEVNGQQLLHLRPDDLDHLGVYKLGHQELILEAVEYLRNFHYELDQENLQLLALRLACRAHSLHNELMQTSDLQHLCTQTLADVAHVIMAVKPLVCWLDRFPFSGQFSYQECKEHLLHLSLQIATCAQRDRFAEKPVEEIRSSCKKLAEFGDEIVQDIVDPLVLQPASLNLVTLKKKASDDLGFFVLPSFHGAHQIAELNFTSSAHQCGKIENGDEIVQVNYQTVVGWQTKKVIALFEESPTDIFLTLKKCPRHAKVYGQIYMKPYRLPSKKRSAPYSHWNESIPSPRPELLTIPDFEIPLVREIPKKCVPKFHAHFELNAALSTFITQEKKDEVFNTKFERKYKVDEVEDDDNDDDDDDDDDDEDDDDTFLPETADESQASPTSMRLYLPKPRVTVQRRATITGASPTSKRPPINVQQFWAELRLEREWQECGAAEYANRRKNDLYQLRDKSASVGNGLSCQFSRPCTTLGIQTLVSNLKCLHQNSETLISEENLNPATELESIALEVHRDVDQCVVNSHVEKCIFNQGKKTVRCISLADDKVVHEGDEISQDVENSMSCEVPLDDFPCDISLEISTDTVCEKTACFADDDGYDINFPVIGHFSSLTENNSEVLSQETVLDCKKVSRMENGGKDEMFQSFCLNNFCKHAHERGCSINCCDQWAHISGKIRGRLDKSFSTPAYDPLESITYQKKNFFNERSLRQKSENIEKETVATKVVCSSQKSEGELNSSPHILDVKSTEPTLFIDDYNTHGIKEFGKYLTVVCDSTSCLNENSEPSSSLLFCEENNDRIAGSTFKTSALEIFLSGNEASNIPVKYVGESLSERGFMHEMDTDFYPAENAAESVSNAYYILDVNLLNKKVAVTQATEVTCMPFADVDVPEQPFNFHNCIKKTDSHSSDFSGKNQKSEDSMCKEGKSLQLSPKFDSSKPSLKIISTCGTVGTGLGVRSITSKCTTKVFPAASFSSPRSIRKQNALLSKRRKVSVKDVGRGEFEGWLFHRFRSSGGGATWLKLWFILKGVMLYGFKTPRATRAHIMIVLPGFTVCVAEEVKSRSFPFKIYYTGTVFYFAAETVDEFGPWLGHLSAAANSQELVKTPANFVSQNIYFSETDGDSDCQKDSDSETGTSKNDPSRLDGSSNCNQQLGKFHQNPKYDSKKTDSPKLFGSLKKIVSRTGGELAETPLCSLDRKYLNFFGTIRNSNIPVPTAQFRSYRRAPNNRPLKMTEVTKRKVEQICDSVCLPKKDGELLPPSKHISFGTQAVAPATLKCSKEIFEDTSSTSQNISFTHTAMSSDRCGVSTKLPKNFKAKLDLEMSLESGDESKLQFHKVLKLHNIHDHKVHASNPNLQLSYGVLNYNLTAEETKKNVLPKNQEEDLTGFVTFEKFMSNLEEEKFKEHQLNLNSLCKSGYSNISPHQPLDKSNVNFVKDSENMQNNVEVSSSTVVPCEMRYSHIKNPVDVSNKEESCNYTQNSIDVFHDIRAKSSKKQSMSTSIQHKVAAQKRVSKLETHTAINSTWRGANLKAAAQYQPPPMSRVLVSRRKVHPKDDGPKMKLAFEMHLDENKFSTAPNKDAFPKPSKFRNLFLFSKNQNIKCSNGYSSVISSKDQPKTKISSPKHFHKTFLWKKKLPTSKCFSNKPNNFNHAPSISSSSVPAGWMAELSSFQSECNISQVQPLMGMSMISKKPCRLVLASSSSQASSAPDYPDLEYPPVFEPETYTLSDASPFLKSQHHHACTNSKVCSCNTLGSRKTKVQE